MKQLEVFCSCNTPLPVMILGYRTTSDSFFIRSKDRSAHSKDCIYGLADDNQHSSPSVYESGFVKKDSGLTEIKLDGQYFKLYTKGSSTNNNIKTRLPSSQASGTSYNKPSIYALMMRFLTEAWNDLIQFSHYKGFAYPATEIKAIYNHLIKQTLNYYSIGKTQVTDILYKGEAEGKVYKITEMYDFKVAAFTMLLLEDDGIKDNGDKYQLSLRNPTIDQVRQLDVDKVLFDKAMNAIRNIAGPFFVGGFAESTGYKKPPRFISIGVIPINDYGAPVESSYERTLYNTLCTNQRAVVRYTTSNHPSWHGYIPDGILIDTKPYTLLEVFGLSKSMESYHIQRRIKIDHFTKLSPIFEFWYWDAFSTRELPTIPDI